ncbi:MAG: putative transcriptional regulator, ModE family [Xanthobacteraceae bacterium]|jgi:molybdate transport system regulatory protein|nr:putative transcriptional regulator, ModE family [Xanthobacteraceae bacterium]
MPAKPPPPPPDHDAHDAPRDGLFIRLYFGDGRFIGPGKIELLETIRLERSILSAARKMGMSYRRAWLLVDELDRMFNERVVETFPGRRGRGTELTAFGERLIALYRGIERDSAQATREATEELRAALAESRQPPPEAAKPSAPTPPASRRQSGR